MTNEDSTRRAGQPYALMGPDGQTPWPVSRSHDPLQYPHDIACNQLEDASIDPQLGNGKKGSEHIRKPTQQQVFSPNGQLLHDGSQRPGSGAVTRISGLESSAPAPRLLPSQDVSDETFDEAYVSFILYCNPAIPSDTDTAELRKTFRSPPKSDGKSFSTFTLFELIRKLEQKVIKTWAQLAIDLGVEPPAVDKGQSAQKVQQYAVRLKRWMHAMHVDAFFEYLLQKNHVYWTQIPSIHDPPSEFGRDGVPPEEDLAVRALLPETRPKRGRRKAEDKDKDSDLSKSPAQRPRLHSPTLSEDFAMARGNLGDNFTPSTGRSEWSSSDVRISFIRHPTLSLPPSQVQQQWNQKDPNQTPFTPYPQSATIPRTQNPFLPYEGEPQSAITPSSSRSRRRHGPAVSSAWPSSGNFPAGKLRGRPPSNRSISDGPFSTFPANPNTRLGPTINLRDNNIATTPIVDNTEPRTSAFTFPETAPNSRPQGPKPSRLYLQVPERVGGIVRLATPPPPVMVNGENQMSQDTGLDAPASRERCTASIIDYQPSTILDRRMDQDKLRSASKGAILPSKGSAHSSTSSDLSFREELGEDRTNVAKIHSLFTHRLVNAEWYDEKGLRIAGCTQEEADEVAQQVIRNLRDEATTKETFLINLAALTGGEFLRASQNYLKMTRLEPEDQEISYGVKWSLKYGAVEGTFDMKINVRKKPAAGQNEGGSDDDELDPEILKSKYMELRSRVKQRDAEVKDLRKNLFAVALGGFGL